ncbi:MAG: hypothetical protein NWE83_13245 [Candidatus Bathyarchaeota archaeon]|nr:hypothetical protein [Candidatus Bathyarchaeota archaeon]
MKRNDLDAYAGILLVHANARRDSVRIMKKFLKTSDNMPPKGLLLDEFASEASATQYVFNDLVKYREEQSELTANLPLSFSRL